MEEDLYRFEDVDGVRMPFNVWPRSKVESLKCVLPFSALYTPVKAIENLQTLPYEPVMCKQCSGVLNPLAQVDFNTKQWLCPLCHARNNFPAHYQGVTADLLPAELFPDHSTIEYTLNKTAQAPPVFIFIVDVSVIEDELETCKVALVQALQLMPEHCSIGLITFGTHVHVHDLTQSEITKSYVFRGSGDFPVAAVAQQLGLHRVRPDHPHPALRFLVPLAQAEFQVTQALEDIQVDAYPAVADHRASRCTGTAVQVAAGLAAAGLPAGGCAARLLLFTGGPCTEGRGKIVPQDQAVNVRSHKDLAKDAAPLWRPAVAFYDGLAKQMVASAHSLDVFACALEQCGLAEMKPLIQATGGLVVLTDTFRNPVFKESLARVFADPGVPGALGTCTCGTLAVHVSRDIKVQGVLGCVAASDKPSPAVASTVVGAGGTTEWRLAALDGSTTACIFFDITADKNGASDARAFFLQFVTRYLHWDGTFRCRVTTVVRGWAEGTSPTELVGGFDQEAAAVMLARYCTWKMETEEDFDATRWIDRSLIRLAQRFGEYQKDSPDTFKMLPEMLFFPSFMFHLRRSQFVQVFGNSPDETAVARIMLNRENTRNAILMIQPQLFSYAMSAPPQPVILDVASIQPETILFLDSYFYLVVFHGSTIAQWREKLYQEDPEYAEFAELLRQPQVEVARVEKTRFPVPRVVDSDNHTVHGRSQSRFLLAKLNPSSTHSSANAGGAGTGEIIFTDDVSLDVFMAHLTKLAVAS